MSLRNFHVNANVSDQTLLTRSSAIFQNIIASYRQAVANGQFNFGFIQPSDPDLNRIHAIVTEINSRRLFFACSEDENPHWAMISLYEARTAIREASKGVWATPELERLIQDLQFTLSEFCTQAERLNAADLSWADPNYREFLFLMTDMRIKVWLHVAVVKKKLGGIIQPRNLPTELWNYLDGVEV